MTQDQLTAAELLPQAPDGLEVRCRYLYGKEGKQPCSSGGFFSGMTKGTGMTQADLQKAAAITIDVDAYDWEGGAERWGATRDERKAAMRAASAGEVIQWLKDTKFHLVVRAACVAVGLPARPNRTIYTGQGLCLIYWFGEDVGWADEAKNKWTAAKAKALIKRFHEQAEGLWWWDRDAKDIGTRLFPLPGGFHRDTGKPVRVVDGHSEVFDFAKWFDALDAKYPASSPVKVKTTKKTTAKAKAASNGAKFTGSGAWTVITFDPKKHTVLNVGQKAPCPLCGGSGYKRLDDAHYTCFSCETQLKVAPSFNFNPKSFEQKDDGLIKLNAKGHALWPDTIPPRLVNAARTGSGKTELMKKAKAEWEHLDAHAFAGDRRTIIITPTIALAGVAAERLNIAHGEAGSDVDWRKGSFAACFASLTAKTYGLHGPALASTYLIMDEAETTLSQLVGLLDAERGRETYSLLVNLAARAGRVMLADAHAGPVVERFLHDVKKAEEADNIKPKPWELWKTAPHRHAFHYVQPLTKTDKNGEEVVVQSSDAMHRGLIAQSVAAGKRVAVYVPGHFAAKALARTLAEKFPALNIQVRVRNHSNDQKNDLTQNGLTADVLIYNNSMNTGVSFDVKGHYDEVHLLLGRGSVTDAVHVEQALHRVRHPVCKTFFVSGTVANPITDWRCDPAKQLEAGINRLKAGQKAVTSMVDGLTLASDWMFEAASKRLAGMQATIIASRYSRGFRWALSYLAAHHDFKAIDGVEDADFCTATKTARESIEKGEAQAIAEAYELPEHLCKQVEAHGAETEEEYYRYRAAKLAQVFEAAFEEAPVEDRAEIVMQTNRKRLVEKTRVFAMTRMLTSEADTAQAVRAEIRSNARQSIMTAKVNLPAARVVDALMRGIGAGVQLVDGRWTVDHALALDLVKQAKPFMDAAGMELRADADVAPIRQLQTLLGYAGLALRMERVGTKGNRERVYFLSLPDVERMMSLSEAFVTRWREHGVGFGNVDDDAIMEQIAAAV